MKKQTTKTIIATLTAAAMVCSMAGCAGKTSGTSETSGAENRRQDSTRHMDGVQESMSMSR